MGKSFMFHASHMSRWVDGDIIYNMHIVIYNWESSYTLDTAS
jgi:hypothetical protein